MTLLSPCLAAGCTHTMAPGTAPSMTFRVPGTLPASAVPPAPPPGSTQAAAAPRNGPYAGTGRLVFDPGQRGACRATMPITGFSVANGSATFGRSRAAIDPDGSLQLQAGQRWLTGRFVGANFEGRLWQPPPACTYSVTLTPAG
jgi:hypothetical protein